MIKLAVASLLLFLSHSVLAVGQTQPFPKGTRIECQSLASEVTRITFKIQVQEPISDRIERSLHSFEGFVTIMETFMRKLTTQEALKLLK